MEVVLAGLLVAGVLAAVIVPAIALFEWSVKSIYGYNHDWTGYLAPAWFLLSVSIAAVFLSSLGHGHH